MANLFPTTDRNLILTGYTGPSQPLLGRRVASMLSLPYVHVESKIEERGERPIEEFRLMFGEARLKTLATDVVNEVALHRGAVLRIDGQTLMQADHLPHLQSTGTVICLVAKLDVVLQRLHLALGARYHDPDERAAVMGHVKREWAVRGAEGVHEIDTSYLTDDAIVEATVALWQRVLVGEPA